MTIPEPIPLDLECATLMHSHNERQMTMNTVRTPSAVTRRKGWCLATSLAVFGLVLSGCSSGESQGVEDKLDRPITIIVPFGASGGSDQVSRAAAQLMEKVLGVTMPVVNVPGATGSTGTAKMLAGQPNESIAVFTQDQLAQTVAGSASYKMEELQAVCRMQELPAGLFVKKETFSDWADFKKAATDASGELKAATVGIGGVDDVVFATIQASQNVEVRGVPFPDPGERYAALLGGNVDVMYEQLGDVRQFVESGEYVPLMVFSDEPVDVEGYEDVPLASDLGISDDAILPQFRGFVISTDADKELVRTLSDACVEAANDPKFQKFQDRAISIDGSVLPAEEYQSFITEQRENLEDLFKKHNISAS